MTARDGKRGTNLLVTGVSIIIRNAARRGYSISPFRRAAGALVKRMRGFVKEDPITSQISVYLRAMNHFS